MKNHKISYFFTFTTQGIYDKVSKNHNIFYYFSLKFRYSALIVATFFICENTFFLEIPLKDGIFNVQIMVIFNIPDQLCDDGALKPTGSVLGV